MNFLIKFISQALCMLVLVCNCAYGAQAGPSRVPVDVDESEVPAHVTDVSQIEKYYDPVARRLNLGYLPLTRIDGNVFEQMAVKWPELQEVSFAGTQLSAVPEKIGVLKSLRYLGLSHTNVRELPVVIYELLKLQFLNVAYTPLVQKVDWRTIREALLKKYKYLRITDKTRITPSSLNSSIAANTAALFAQQNSLILVSVAAASEPKEPDREVVAPLPVAESVSRPISVVQSPVENIIAADARPAKVRRVAARGRSIAASCKPMEYYFKPVSNQK